MSTQPIIAVFQPDETPRDPQGNNDMNLKWAPLGINTALLVPGGDPPHDADGWVYRAMLAGLNVIYAPVNSTWSKNLAVGRLTAIASPLVQDEPDINNGDPKALSAETITLAAAFPGIPQYQCVSGGCLLKMQPTPFSDEQYRQILKGKKIVATDFYPISGWGRPDFIARWFDLGARLRSLVDPGTELMAILEMGGQNLPDVPGSAAGPNPAQIRAQAALTLIAGFKHRGWFSIRPPQGGFTFDSSTDDQKAAVKLANQLLKADSDFILHGTLKATVDAPHYRGDWTYNGQVLTITVDMSDTANPTVASSVGAVAAQQGPTPTPAGVTPLAWTLARDIRHSRWNVWLPPLKAGGPQRLVGTITDAGLVSAIDKAVSQAR